MYQLASNEKTTTVMVYSRNRLIHWNLVACMRASILPRMQALTNLLHFILLLPQMTAIHIPMLLVRPPEASFGL